MKKWIWILIAALVVAGGITAAILLWPSSEATAQAPSAESGETADPATQQEVQKIYWNVDKAQYAGLTKTGYTVTEEDMARFEKILTENGALAKMREMM